MMSFQWRHNHYVTEICHQNNGTKIFQFGPLQSKFLATSVMGVGSRGPWLSWISKHGTNIVNKGLKVLFFGLICYFSVFFPLPPPLRKRLNSAIFRYFLLIFGLFSVAPSLENFLPTPLTPVDVLLLLLLSSYFNVFPTNACFPPKIFLLNRSIFLLWKLEAFAISYNAFKQTKFLRLRSVP